MNRAKWIAHISQEGVTPPSQGGDKEAWRTVVNKHKDSNCPHCLARAQSRRAELTRKKKSDFEKALGQEGIRKVKGSMGGTYYENTAKEISALVNEAMFRHGTESGIECPKCDSTDVACYDDKCTCMECGAEFSTPKEG